MSEQETTNSVEAKKAQPKNKKRIILRIIGILLLVLILFFTALIFFIDGIIAGGVRHGGTMILGVKVDIESVRLKILKGSLEMKGLTVENPPGSSEQYAFKLPEFHASLEPASLLSNKIIISDISITGMHINYEPMLKGGSNLQLLLKNLEKAEKAEKEKPVTDPGKKEKGPAKKVVIKHLLVAGGEINTTLLGKSTIFPMPKVEMANIGESSDVSLVEAVTMFLTELVRSIINSSGDLIKDPGAVLKSIEGIKGIDAETSGAVKDAVKNISEMFKSSK